MRLGNDCYTRSATGWVTVHAHFEGGQCVVPDADPEFLARFDAFMDGGWPAWSRLRREQRAAHDPYAFEVDGRTFRISPTPQPLPISPRDAKPGYGEDMSNETPTPEPGSAFTGILGALGALAEFAEKHAPKEPEPGADVEDVADAPLVVYLRPEGEQYGQRGVYRVPFVDGCNAEVTGAGALIVWRRVAGAAEEIARIYAPGVWECVDYPKAEK